MLVHRPPIYSGHPPVANFAMDARIGKRLDATFNLHFTEDERVYASSASSSRSCNGS